MPAYMSGFFVVMPYPTPMDGPIVIFGFFLMVLVMVNVFVTCGCLILNAMLFKRGNESFSMLIPSISAVYATVSLLLVVIVS